MTTARVIVFAGDAEVGRALVRALDPSMGVYGGRFEPGPSYSSVAPCIRSLTHLMLTAHPDDPRLRDAYTAREGLRLRVEGHTGHRLHPETVHMVDASEMFPDEDLALELLGLPHAEAERLLGS